MTIKLTANQKKRTIKPVELFGIMREILMRESKTDRDKEHFWIICLSAGNRITMIELVSLGSVRHTIVEPMDVFSLPLQKNVSKLIMVHNHPSGDMRPSQSDIDLTERMYAIGKFIQMPILDHLIISEKEFYSFNEAGLMRKIEEEKRYDLNFSEIDKVNAQLKKAEKEKSAAEKSTKKAIAIKLLSEGMSVDKIVEILDLTKKAVEKLKT